LQKRQKHALHLLSVDANKSALRDASARNMGFHVQSYAYAVVDVLSNRIVTIELQSEKMLAI